MKQQAFFPIPPRTKMRTSLLKLNFAECLLLSLLKITCGVVEKIDFCPQNNQYLLNPVFIDINMRKIEQVYALSTPLLPDEAIISG